VRNTTPTTELDVEHCVSHEATKERKARRRTGIRNRQFRRIQRNSAKIPDIFRI
jgi:hypothetical protein